MKRELTKEVETLLERIAAEFADGTPTEVLAYREDGRIAAAIRLYDTILPAERRTALAEAMVGSARLRDVEFVPDDATGGDTVVFAYYSEGSTQDSRESLHATMT